MVLPQIHALDERLLVAAPLFERNDIGARSTVADGAGDRRLETVELGSIEQVRHDNEAVVAKRLYEVGGDAAHAAIIACHRQQGPALRPTVAVCAAPSGA